MVVVVVAKLWEGWCDTVLSARRRERPLPATGGHDMSTFICDQCDQSAPMSARWAALTPRPSDPSEIVAVMWFCADCGQRWGADEVAEVERLFDEDMDSVWERWGERVCFLSA